MNKIISPNNKRVITMSKLNVPSLHNQSLAATYSIVAYDRDEEMWGAAVQSKFFAVGSVVPWAQANRGVIITQSIVDARYGERGLALLGKKFSANEVLKKLLSEDAYPQVRQVAIVDSQGEAVSYTGDHCAPIAMGQAYEHFAVQGNFLANEEVVPAMARAYKETEGPLATKLLAALKKAEEIGGDRRGKQSAALLIAKENSGPGENNDKYMDLRVDDHPDPIKELKRLQNLHELYVEKGTAEEKITITPAIKQQIITALTSLNDISNYSMEKGYEKMLQQFMLNENLLHRNCESGYINEKVFCFLRDIAAKK